MIFISHSGNTEECVTAATHLITRGVTTLALTGGKGLFHYHVIMLHVHKFTMIMMELLVTSLTDMYTIHAFLL